MTTLTIEISDTLDEKVTDAAKRSKLSKEQLAEKALEDFVERQAKNGSVRDTESDNDEKIKAFEKWMNNLDPNTPGLTDEQISRESMYEEQIKKQL